MRSTVIARALLGLAALAVAAGLVALQRDRDRCERAMAAVFVASERSEPDLARPVDELIAGCSGSEPLTRIAVGLRVDRPAAAARLARAAADREPDSYAAWGVLAVSAPEPEAATAAARARALNPLSSRAGP